MKIGMSTCGRPLNYETFRSFSEAGIECMEISGSDNELWSLDYNYIKSLSQKYNVELWSFHLPFWPFEKFDQSSLDDALRQKTYNSYCEYIKKASAIGIKRFISHMSSEPIPQEERPIRIENAKDFFSRIADFADKYDAQILVENLPRGCLGNCSDEMLEIISVNDKIRTVFDTNHLLSESPIKYIKALAGKIDSLHVSDYDFINERHWMPGEGDIDWQAVISALKETGYSGPWLYEISPDAPHGLVREHQVSTFDLAKNAKELFDGRKPTVFSERPEVLPFWA